LIAIRARGWWSRRRARVDQRSASNSRCSKTYSWVELLPERVEGSSRHQCTRK
jgi:hypothetical protein